jgi:small GTP-binding protein
MMSKKICLLGAFAVGKTSLVSRFVTHMFSEKYHTTVGVKIEKKIIRVHEHEIALLIWDLAGEDEFQRVEPAYLQGASGYFLVVDGTRRATLDQALLLQERAQAALGAVPFLLLVNKADLANDWEIGDPHLEELSRQGWSHMKTSAKAGDGVEAAFLSLAQTMIAG